MTTATMGKIYHEAAQRDIQVLDLESPTNGRSWHGKLKDVRHPDRPYFTINRETTENVVYWIARYENDRQLWVDTKAKAEEHQRQEAEKAAAEEAAERERLEALERAQAERLAAIAEAAAPKPLALPEIIELPGDDAQAYEDGYNAGLSEGLRIAGEGGIPVATVQQNLDNALEIARITEQAVEQARRQFLVDQAVVLQDERDAAYRDGKADAEADLEARVAQQTIKLAAQNEALKSAIAEIKQGALYSAAYIDATHQATMHLVDEFRRQVNNLSVMGTNELRDKELEWESHVDRVIAKYENQLAHVAEQEAAK